MQGSRHLLCQGDEEHCSLAAVLPWQGSHPHLQPGCSHPGPFSPPQMLALPCHAYSHLAISRVAKLTATTSSRASCSKSEAQLYAGTALLGQQHCQPENQAQEHQGYPQQSSRQEASSKRPLGSSAANAAAAAPKQPTHLTGTALRALLQNPQHLYQPPLHS